VDNKESSNTVAFPKWVLILIGIGVIIWLVISMMPEPERTYRIQGTIQTEVEIHPLPP